MLPSTAMTAAVTMRVTGTVDEPRRFELLIVLTGVPLEHHVVHIVDHVVDELPAEPPSHCREPEADEVERNREQQNEDHLERCHLPFRHVSCSLLNGLDESSNFASLYCDIMETVVLKIFGAHATEQHPAILGMSDLSRNVAIVTIDVEQFCVLDLTQAPE